MTLSITPILLGCGILLSIVFVWFGVTYWLTPHVDKPDGKARVTGSCGDTMVISLRIKKGRVVESDYWANGCAYSLNCVCAAAGLAKGKTPDEILEIDPEMIQESVGGLPRDQMHCARLSVETLYAAMDDYMRKR